VPVRDFVRLSFAALGIGLEFHGSGESEAAVDAKTGRTLVRVNPRFYRPAEVDALIGDASKAERVLGWQPRLDLENLCRMMVEADMDRNRTGRRS